MTTYDPACGAGAFLANPPFQQMTEPEISNVQPRLSSFPGRLIVLEGIDGCGKSTQIEALRRWLPDSGLMPAGAELIISKEPGGTPFGQAVRQLLLHPAEAAAPCSTSELLLFAADRAQHVQTVIRPALAAGHWVLCDRFSGSTAAYQGYGRGLSLELIDELERIATAGLRPDLTLWLDLHPALARLRLRRRDRPDDRIETAGEAFLARVRAGFARLAGESGWARVDAASVPRVVTRECQVVLHLFSRQWEGA